MADASNFDGVGIGADKQEAVVANAQPKFFPALKCLDVTHARLCKAKKRGEDLHRDGLTQAADITFGGISPDNPSHFGSR
jgi:hypothetical protein